MTEQPKGEVVWTAWLVEVFVTKFVLVVVAVRRVVNRLVSVWGMVWIVVVWTVIVMINGIVVVTVTW